MKEIELEGNTTLLYLFDEKWLEAQKSDSYGQWDATVYKISLFFSLFIHSELLYSYMEKIHMNRVEPLLLVVD